MTTKLTKTQAELAKHITVYGYAALHVKRVKTALQTARSMYMKQRFSYLACGHWVIISTTPDLARKAFDLVNETFKVK